MSLPALENRSFLQIYKERIDLKIIDALSHFGPQTPLYEACQYALTGEGKRFRPAVILMVAEALGRGVDVTQAALAVEFFHTASLIADDLPSMDDDAQRRDRPSTHIAYGEEVALLASYALIAAGYQCLAKNSREMEIQHPELFQKVPNIAALAIEIASRCTGILGATGGQYLDLLSRDISLELIKEIFYKKTATLLSFHFF